MEAVKPVRHKAGDAIGSPRRQVKDDHIRP
jgi:hypothetical protein